MNCIAKHRDDRGPHQADVGFLCRPAYLRLEKQLTELVALSGWLKANVGSGGTSALDPNRVSASKDKPVPIKVGIADHVQRITDTVNSWARIVAEEANLRGPWRALPAHGWPERDRLRRAVEQTASLENLTTFLHAQLEWSAAQPWVDDYADEISDLHRDAHQLVPSKPAKHRLPVPCPDPECDLLALVRVDGAAYVECEACGRLWLEAEYKRLTVVLSGDVKPERQIRHDRLIAAEDGTDSRTGHVTHQETA